ncbi:MAG: DUF362 domain-containing protein [Candidatus Thorarchaeota archaeon]|nr:MAG: DUF362 domain-containing protein [Candidatus Thorarchaeota archaeon]
MSRTPYMKDGKYLVGKVRAVNDLKISIEESVELIGGFAKVINEGDTVTIKPNLNTADPCPACSDSEFIRALGEAIYDAGASKLKITDSSTMMATTSDVAQKAGISAIADDLDAELVFLDEHPWVKTKFPRGKYLKSGSIGAPLKDRGKLVLAPCLKTHFLARFTASMKLFVGWIRHRERIRMHTRKLEEKIADLASFFEPDLIVMDARRCFVTGGPSSGDVEEPGLILASGDMVSIDVTGVRILQSFGAKNKLNMNVWDLPQIRHAVDLEVGAKSDDEILVVESE